MKKIIYGILLFIFCIIPVKADTIYSIDMHVYIDKDGTANITEIWDVKADSGSEWYKAQYNLGNSNLTDFVVYMDNKKLQEKTWNVGENLSEKAGYYGINYADEGLELCFGKNDYNRHKFTLKYNISNYIFNTTDSQVLYQKLIDKMTIKNYSIVVKSYYSFPSTLDVWGYGSKGYAYVKDGQIEMSNEGDVNNNSAILLVKFPLNTFNTKNTYSKFNTFDDVLNESKKGSYTYNYDKLDFYDILAILEVSMFIIAFPIMLINGRKLGYGYKNNKKILKNDTPFFRDIPCNKDIYYANTLAKLNSKIFNNYKETNIFGAIILKWLKEDKIIFKNEKSNKKTSSIILNKEMNFDNTLEKELYDMMYTASEDGILETKELEKYAKENYNKFFNLFERINKVELEKLENENHIYKRTNKKECKKEKVMDDTIYEESVKLYGLKKYLEYFSNIKTKEVVEVKLLDEYLMYAYIFGIADKVAKQLKNLYPEVVANFNYDYDDLIIISNISTRTYNVASSARSSAEAYNSGGGGFASGGGGGGSFGGGGGGGR